MTHAVVDDHLLRELVADDVGDQLRLVVDERDLATTNLYFVRLCKTVVGARGGQLTGSWSRARRRALGQRLLQLPDSILVVPMRLIGYRIAELAASHRVSTLGAEAIVAAEHLGGPLCVWDGDAGPGIRAAAAATQISYRTVSR
ncbi:MAG: hypothetical protein M3083_07180 [Actinomycetota bacterium]|nr:hypothetical protein [Actinomycetota bacterium]